MTKEEKSRYSEPEALRDILKRVLTGRKFLLDCGHRVSFGSNLGNDITIINGKEFKIICSLSCCKNSAYAPLKHQAACLFPAKSTQTEGIHRRFSPG